MCAIQTLYQLSYIPQIKFTNYKSYEKKDLVKNKSFIDLNIETEKFKVIDARSKERFEGKVPEPRAGLRSGCSSAPGGSRSCPACAHRSAGGGGGIIIPIA